jgi:tetratricopeptide (TPR) repeat protein
MKPQIVFLLFFLCNICLLAQNSNELTQLVEKGDSFCQDGEYDKGIRSYTAALKFDQKSPEAYQKRGNAYFSIKKFDLAVSDYTKALSNNPDNPEIIYVMRGLSKSLLEKEDKKGACEDFRKAKNLGYDLKEMTGLNEYCGADDLE